MAKKKKPSDAEKLEARATKTFHLDPEEGIDCAFLATVEAEIAMRGELTVKRARTFLRICRRWALYQIAVDFLGTPKLMKGTRAQQLKRWKNLTLKLGGDHAALPLVVSIPLPVPPTPSST